MLRTLDRITETLPAVFVCQLVGDHRYHRCHRRHYHDRRLHLHHRHHDHHHVIQLERQRKRACTSRKVGTTRPRSPQRAFSAGLPQHQVCPHATTVELS